MTRSIASAGCLASESLSLRPPAIEDFRDLTSSVAKYSLLPAPQNPCATDIGTVFSQTLINNNDSGPGSLRQAILDNDGLGGGNCICFSTNVTGTITLTSGSLVMNMSGQIIGPGAKVLSVSGNHNGRVFDIRNGPTTISGLTIR